MLQFIEKSLNVLEVAVNRSEAHISNLVQVAQALHDLFSYLCSRYFPISAISQLGLDGIHYFGQFRHRHRPLFTGLEKPGEHLLAVEFFPAAIFFYYHVRNLIAPFICRETAFAAQALPAPADHFAFLALTGVDNAILLEAAEGTGHRGTS